MRYVLFILAILGSLSAPASAQAEKKWNDDIIAALERGQCHDYRTMIHLTRRDISGGISNEKAREKIKQDYERACKAELDEVQRRIDAGTCPRLYGFFSRDVLDRGLTAKESDDWDVRHTPKELRRFQAYDKAMDTCPAR